MNYNFKNLVFEGGGVKGIAYGGALDVLDQKKLLQNITRVAGTSAGAINATLLALGYSSKEVSDIVADTDFSSFEDSSSFFSDVLRVIKKFGWNKGDAFTDFMREQIRKKTNSADFTFEQLNQTVTDNGGGFRHLYVASTNLSAQKVQVFSHEDTPDVKIADAARMSMSIPLYFKAFKWHGDIMVDGGVSYNYPIDLFDNVKYLDSEKNGKKETYSSLKGHVFNYETLGFRLDSKEVIEYARNNWAIPPKNITNIKKYSLSLVDFMMEMANRTHLHQNDWGRTVFIDTLGVKTTDFKGVKERIDDLINSGKKAVSDYFNWRDKDAMWSIKPNFPEEKNDVT